MFLGTRWHIWSQELNDFRVSKGHTYKCSERVTRKLNGTEGAIPGEFEISDVLIDPFRSKNAKQEFESGWQLIPNLFRLLLIRYQ